MTLRACAACFSASSWVANASPPTGSTGTCDFGHEFSHRTWVTTAWVDSFTQLFALYEPGEDGSGEQLHIQIQSDWSIFALDREDDVQRFLQSAIPGHPLLDPDVKVKLRTPSDGPPADHLSTWALFSEEIRTRNRYFPQGAPNRIVLEEALAARKEFIAVGQDLFRARVLPRGETFSTTDMGAPPPHKTPAGRANPVGIPYLYLSFSKETCLYEARVANHARVAVGTMRTLRELVVVDLADIEAPDFFGTYDDLDDVDLQTPRVLTHRYLKALGEDLRRPVDIHEQPTDYIATQYLCEFAKSAGYDGVLYASSQQPRGRNVVLFDKELAECVSVETVKVVELTARFEPAV